MENLLAKPLCTALTGPFFPRIRFLVVFCGIMIQHFFR